MRLFRKWRRYLRMSDGVNDGMGVDVNVGVSEDMDDAKKYVMRKYIGNISQYNSKF